jgi:hypothetical protein
VAYKKCFKNGGGNAKLVIDLEEEGPNNGALPSLLRDHKATKADLRQDASALAISETLKGLMAMKEEALAKKDEKRHRKKEATCTSFINLTNKVIEIEDSK